MALFDKVNFNGEVFDTVVRNTPNTKMNALLKSGAIVEKPQYASMLSEQKGGNYITRMKETWLKIELIWFPCLILDCLWAALPRSLKWAMVIQS